MSGWRGLERVPDRWLLPAACMLLGSCGHYGRVGLDEAPKVVNVSSYDPKERQRSGRGYSSFDVSALRENGVAGLIARAGKGGRADDKCADFLAAADRQGLRLGTYHFVAKGVDPGRQAEVYVARLKSIAARRGLRGKRILLVGDFDRRSEPEDLVMFIDRIEALTGVLPVIYLENDAGFRRRLQDATREQKQRIAGCSYWLALYAPHPDFETPKSLAKGSGIWNTWAMWQYGGVEWDAKRGRSASKHYHHGPWRAPEYFGDMDRPLEHNAFNGSLADLEAFWQKHSWRVP
ncbi:MAG: GH25 family lysozyme [Verrucomicrobiales bacterium]|nr:GH25 family lysozyme [Verrucomicrobiota bacterium JB025]